MKTIRITAVLLVAGAALLFWSRFDSADQKNTPVAAQDAPLGSAAPPQPASPTPGAVTPEQQENLEQLQQVVAAVKASKHPSTDSLELALREASNDPVKRRKLLGQLLNYHFSRDDAIRVLKQYLSDPSSGMRVRAAEALYTLGSNAGKETLLDVMQSAIPPTADTLTDAVWAAEVLSHFREPVPTNLLIELYNKRGHPGLLEVMAMQGDPAFAPVLIEAATDDPIAGNIRNLGILGAAQCYDFVRETFASAPNEQTKVHAAWAMFRSAGDRSALDYVVAMAERMVTGDLKGAHPNAVEDAFWDLSVTRDDAIRNHFRTWAETTRDAGIGSSALASLFYIHRDYEFVDDFVRAYVGDRSSKKWGNDNLVGQIVAARNDPAITTLARESFTDDFHRIYLAQPRPAEAWIWSYIGYIPMR